MADPKAIQFLESIYSRVDKQVREIVTSMLPNVTVAAQDDGSVIANDHRILNFQGNGVLVSDEPSMRRVNIFVPGAPVTSGSTVVASTAGLEKVYTLTGGNLASAPANWYTVGYNDSAWSSSVAMSLDVSAFY